MPVRTRLIFLAFIPWALIRFVFTTMASVPSLPPVASVASVASVAEKMQADECDSNKKPNPVLRKPIHFLTPYSD